MAPCLQLRIGQHVRVNVFEVNIRVLGGLLSSHLLALDPDLNLLQRPRKQHQKEYTGQLLTHARRLADRMLPAFVESDTGALPEATQPLRSCRAPQQSQMTAVVCCCTCSHHSVRRTVQHRQHGKEASAATFGLNLHACTAAEPWTARVCRHCSASKGNLLFWLLDWRLQ